MRLDRMLGALNVCTRSECRKLLHSVTVNGAPVKDAGMNVTESDIICVRGARLDTRLQRCLVMNKPAGVLTAAEDKKARTVMDLLPPLYASLGCMPVGRLDRDTTGLLLLTTDGQLAHRLISPKNHVDKVY
ncbi:MAG: 16S rRNA pseudouridine(516) synthase, partial [Clostridiales bacterium]|nr:16S rRNA pseudouridine(516) synthase [Clostridiales bacterium]